MTDFALLSKFLHSLRIALNHLPFSSCFSNCFALCPKTYCDLLVGRLPCLCGVIYAAAVCTLLRLSMSTDIVHICVESLGVTLVESWVVGQTQPDEYWYLLKRKGGIIFHSKKGVATFYQILGSIWLFFDSPILSSYFAACSKICITCRGPALGRDLWARNFCYNAAREVPGKRVCQLAHS